ncbi:MAG: hypothetical protein ABI576_07675 [Flavobacterium sp.]
MINNNETNTLIDLTAIELMNIDGGAPTAETGFFYDAAYYTVVAGRLYAKYIWHFDTY